MSKFFKSMMLVACMAAFSFAQEDEYSDSPASYESTETVAQEESAPAAYESSESTEATVSATQAAEPAKPASFDWCVNIHPISTFILTALGAPSIYLTVERSLAEHLSLMVRPSFIYLGIEEEGGDGEASLYQFGLAAGARYYINPNNVGLFGEGSLQYQHAGVSVSEDGESAEASANVFYMMVAVGWKFLLGRADFSVDFGLGYGFASASASSTTAEKDLNSNVDSGFMLDLNISVGVAF